jgi:hypothetical protein
VGKYDADDQCYRDPKYKVDNKNFINGFQYLNDCASLKAAVAKQPVSIGMNSNT